MREEMVVVVERDTKRNGIGNMVKHCAERILRRSVSGSLERSQTFRFLIF